jgi:hypothetical protein
MNIKYIEIVALSLILLTGAHSQTFESDTLHTNKAETFIYKYIKQGSIDLKSYFKTPSDRVIRAAFIQQILMDNDPKIVNRHLGFRLLNATIVGKEIQLSQDIQSLTYFEDCTFNCNVIFMDCDFEGDLFFINDRFNGEVFLTASKIRRLLLIDSCLFNRSVNMSFLRSNVLQGVHSTFKDKASFANIKIESTFNLVDCIFEAMTEFLGSEIEGLSLTGCMFNKKVDFTYTVVNTGINLRSTTFNDSCDFGFLRCEDYLLLNKTTFNSITSFHKTSIAGVIESEKTTFNDSTDMSYAVFNELNVEGIKFGKKGFVSNMQGVGISRVTGGADDPTNCSLALEFLNHSHFSVDSYQQVEKTFTDRNLRQLANRIFIERREKERSYYLKGFAWFIDEIQWILYGYGRTPEFAFIWALLLFIVGSFVFAEKSMIKKVENPANEGMKYSRLAFSFNLLIPFVQLPYSTLWIPKNGMRKTWWWYHIHKIGGWLTITIGLVAITGILK